jgi:alkylation response protein AidB-like acyl-CoA dehydrogenase
MSRSPGWRSTPRTSWASRARPRSGFRWFLPSAGSYWRRKWSAAAAALSHASRWAATRLQFKAPIGSLQAVQHRLADAYIDVVTAQDSVYDAAGIIDRGDEARVVAAAAKAHCSDACRRVTAAAHQVCGGEGIYADQPLHLWHRRIAALVPVLGTVRSLRAIVARSILPADGLAASLFAEPPAR